MFFMSLYWCNFFVSFKSRFIFLCHYIDIYYLLVYFLIVVFVSLYRHFYYLKQRNVRCFYKQGGCVLCHYIDILFIFVLFNQGECFYVTILVFFCLSLFILHCITGFATLFAIKSKWRILHLYKRVGVVYVTKAYLMSTITNAWLVVIIANAQSVVIKAIDVFYAYIHTSAVSVYIHTSAVDMLYSIQRWLLVCFTAHQVCFLFFYKIKITFFYTKKWSILWKATMCVVFQATRVYLREFVPNFEPSTQMRFAFVKELEKNTPITDLY